MLKNLRRGVLTAIAVSLVAVTFSPVAHAAKAPKPDLVWYLSSPDRSVVDLPPTGPSLGDITVSNGDIDKTLGKDPIGFYSTNQTTVRVNIPGGREVRSVSLGLSMPGGVVYATALIRANSGTPPTKAQVFAIVGGTGKYAGVSGELIHSGFTASGSKVELFFSK
jgi:hypothetical protein